MMAGIFFLISSIASTASLLQCNLLSPLVWRSPPNYRKAEQDLLTSAVKLPKSQFDAIAADGQALVKN